MHIINETQFIIINNYFFTLRPFSNTRTLIIRIIRIFRQNGSLYLHNFNKVLSYLSNSMSFVTIRTTVKFYKQV
jgi:hypothetical protein